MDWNITQIASVILCATFGGLTLSAMGHSPIIGYIIVGTLMGPSCFCVINNSQSVHLFSEMGILFLLFAVGLNLSFDKLRSTWRSAIGVTFVSGLVLFVTVFAVGELLGWHINSILFISFCLTLSSTAVTVKSLDKIKEENSIIESSIIGILIAQDLVALVMIIVLKLIGENSNDEFSAHKLVAVVFSVLCITIYFNVYHRHIHRFTNFIKKHDDILALTTCGICLGSGVLAELAGLSAAFGAFLAGLILGNSNIKQELKTVISPIEEILLMTFFLSIGLLVDLKFIYENIGWILISLLILMFGKTILNMWVLRFFKYNVHESFIISVLLAHLGEFSFLLTSTAVSCSIIDEFGRNFVISLTAISLFLSPFWLIFAKRCQHIATSKKVHISSLSELIKVTGHREIRAMHKLYSIFSKIIPSLRLIIQKSILLLLRIRAVLIRKKKSSIETDNNHINPN